MFVRHKDESPDFRLIEKVVRKLGLSSSDGCALEAGFCNWCGGASQGDNPIYYEMGQRLAKEFAS